MYFVLSSLPVLLSITGYGQVVEAQINEQRVRLVSATPLVTPTEQPLPVKRGNGSGSDVMPPGEIAVIALIGLLAPGAFLLLMFSAVSTPEK